MFTIAASGEFVAVGGQLGVGAGASIAATVTDGITINLGGRFWDFNVAAPADDVAQAEAQLVAAVTETLTLTAGIGAYADSTGIIDPYATGIVAWNPGGGFTTSLRGDVIMTTVGGPGFRTEFNAAKSFN